MSMTMVRRICLMGEFNGWNPESDPMVSVGNGSWVLYLPGDDALWESCRVKTVAAHFEPLR